MLQCKMESEPGIVAAETRHQDTHDIHQEPHMHQLNGGYVESKEQTGGDPSRPKIHRCGQSSPLGITPGPDGAKLSPKKGSACDGPVSSLFIFYRGNVQLATQMSRAVGTISLSHFHYQFHESYSPRLVDMARPL